MTAASQAMMDAELALAHQNSATAQVDLQVISAILNAHLNAAAGRDALNTLQAETEAAVRTRADLDTPAGARDFQRFLVGKLRDIRSVVANASLDDTSKSALMTAWTSLYDASKGGLDPAAEHRPAAAGPIAAAPGVAGQASAVLPDAGLDPYLESLLADDPGVFPGEAGEGVPPPGVDSSVPTIPAMSAMPAMPMLPSIPNLGGGLMPGAGSGPGWGASGGAPFAGLLPAAAGDRSPTGLDPQVQDPESAGDSDQPEEHDSTEAVAAAASTAPVGATTVTLPDGDTVTAASPQLAAAITAATHGAAIPDAFRQQGITIPAPGTPVAKPLDPAGVSAGDIGIFTDRHALALGHSKALLNGQIQHISTIKGPSFLGWEHPPGPAPVSEPGQVHAPTPTRPAVEPEAHLGGPSPQSSPQPSPQPAPQPSAH